MTKFRKIRRNHGGKRGEVAPVSLVFMSPPASPRLRSYPATTFLNIKQTLFTVPDFVFTFLKIGELLSVVFSVE